MKTRSPFGWLELALGVLFLALGAFAFANPSASLGGIVAAYGITAIIGGIIDIFFYTHMERGTGVGPVTSLVGGIFDILLGALLLFNVRAGIIAISLLLPFWFIVRCVIRLASLRFVKYIAGRAAFFLALLFNILGIFVGVLLLLNPFASALSLAYFVAAYMVMAGTSCILLSFSGLGRR